MTKARTKPFDHVNEAPPCGEREFFDKPFYIIPRAEYGSFLRFRRAIAVFIIAFGYNCVKQWIKARGSAKNKSCLTVESAWSILQADTPPGV